MNACEFSPRAVYDCVCGLRLATLRRSVSQTKRFCEASLNGLHTDS